jgi:WD40 repeat protein
MVGTVMSFSPDGSLFALGTDKGRIALYDGKTFEELEIFQASSDIVNDLAISSDNAYLGATFAIPTLVTEGNTAFTLLTLPDGKEIQSYPLDEDIYGGGVTIDENNLSVYFSTINMMTSNATIATLNIATHQESAIYEGTSSNRHDLLINSKDKTLFYIGSEGVQAVPSESDDAMQNRVFGATQKGESIIKIALHPTEPILAVGFFKRTPRPDGGPSATNAGIIRLYNTSTGDELVSLDVPEGAITSLVFSPDGTLLASGGADGTVRLWGVPAAEK